MKKKKKRKFPVNAKITTGTCLINAHEYNAPRNHFKFCSDACKQQEYLARQKSGFTELAFKGTKEGLIEFLIEARPAYLNSLSMILYGRIQPDETEKIINAKGSDKSWIEQTKDFRLYYIAHNPKNPFELYYTEEQYADWKLNEMLKKLRGPK